MSPAPQLRISLVQTSLAWEDKETNLDHLSKLIAPLTGKTDVVILPEMFSTGFSMNATSLAEDDSGAGLAWMKKQAARLDAVVTGSLITEDKGQFYNRLYWVTPDGEVKHYDKRHLFSFANEEQYYSAGEFRLIVEYKGWRICPLVCYDLRFPVWSRNHHHDGTSADTLYDLLIYVANWPKARRKPWMTLLEARAHENQVYVAGVNRIGEDGKGIDHSGDSALYSPKGEKLSTLAAHAEGVETVTLDWQALAEFREKFTVWKDKDDFRLI